MEYPTHKTTECEHPTCPHKLDSEQRGMINFPSYCIDIADVKHDAFYVCLPCGYKCGAVA